MGRVVLNPPPTRRLLPSDQLVVIAHSDTHSEALRHAAVVTAAVELDAEAAETAAAMAAEAEERSLAAAMAAAEAEARGMGAGGRECGLAAEDEGVLGAPPLAVVEGVAANAGRGMEVGAMGASAQRHDRGSAAVAEGERTSDNGGRRSGVMGRSEAAALAEEAAAAAALAGEAAAAAARSAAAAAALFDGDAGSGGGSGGGVAAEAPRVRCYLPSLASWEEGTEAEEEVPLQQWSEWGEDADGGSDYHEAEGSFFAGRRVVQRHVAAVQGAHALPYGTAAREGGSSGGWGQSGGALRVDLRPGMQGQGDGEGHEEPGRQSGQGQYPQLHSNGYGGPPAGSGAYSSGHATGAHVPFANGHHRNRLPKHYSNGNGNGNDKLVASPPHSNDQPPYGAPAHVPRPAAESDSEAELGGTAPTASNRLSQHRRQPQQPPTARPAAQNNVVAVGGQQWAAGGGAAAALGVSSASDIPAHTPSSPPASMPGAATQRSRTRNGSTSNGALSPPSSAARSQLNISPRGFSPGTAPAAAAAGQAVPNAAARTAQSSAAGAAAGRPYALQVRP